MINNYRPEIDGLRALAVIPVIFFHAGFSLFKGGYIGVDIFFVISGYLITNLIIIEINNKSFSITNFYERRARRILPALIFVILISSILSFVFLTKSELGSYFRSVNASLLFYSNFYFWKNQPYFIADSVHEPLLHTWSLSIEEQFYIFFPLILIYINKFFKKYIIYFFVIVFILSLLFSQYAALKTSGILNFYFTVSRAWELILGSICAYIIIYKNISLNKFWTNCLSILGVVFILFSILFFDSETAHPSFYTLLPTTGTALIILFTKDKSYLKKILSIKILVTIGLISYSLYLWHQPLLSFGRIFFHNFSYEKKLILIFLSIIFSLFTYTFIEKNFRDRNKINFNNFFKITLSNIVILILFAFTASNFFSIKNNSERTMAEILKKSERIIYNHMDDRQFQKNRILVENINPETG